MCQAIDPCWKKRHASWPGLQPNLTKLNIEDCQHIRRKEANREPKAENPTKEGGIEEGATSEGRHEPF
jgi:hypothetical protein